MYIEFIQDRGKNYGFNLIKFFFCARLNGRTVGYISIFIYLFKQTIIIEKREVTVNRVSI